MFRGSIVALVTPFKSDYSIDFDAYARLIDFHLENGTNGIVPCGCTGEAATLTHEEQEQVIEFAIKRVNGQAPVIAGTGSNNTPEAIRLTKFAKDAGADGALVITPYYNKPTHAGLVAHYTKVADEADLPIVIYNVPGRTGRNIEPETTAELSKHKNIVATKEAAGSIDQVSSVISQCEIVVLSGDDSLTLPMLAVGGQGVIGVTSNVLPKQSAQLVQLWFDGDTNGARAMHYELLPLFKGLFIETNPMPVKALLAAMGMIENVLRMPLTPMTSAKWNELEPVAKKMGLI